MKKALFAIFLFGLLTACAPAQPTTNVQSTAFAIVQTGVALTQTALPTSTPRPPTFTPTVIEYTPSPVPTRPLRPPILTPDAIQVERWEEYQAKLAKALFSITPHKSKIEYTSEDYKDALCEWDILGRSDQKVYVWVACRSAKFFNPYIMSIGGAIEASPAVIYLEPGGSIREVKIPSIKINNDLQQIYDFSLFPTGIQEKLCLYYFDGFIPQCSDIISAYIPPYYLQPRLETLFLHLRYREETNIGEPPLVILSANPTATPVP